MDIIMIDAAAMPRTVYAAILLLERLIRAPRVHRRIGSTKPRIVRTIFRPPVAIGSSGLLSPGQSQHGNKGVRQRRRGALIC